MTPGRLEHAAARLRTHPFFFCPSISSRPINDFPITTTPASNSRGGPAQFHWPNRKIQPWTFENSVTSTRLVVANFEMAPQKKSKEKEKKQGRGDGNDDDDDDDDDSDDPSSDYVDPGSKFTFFSLFFFIFLFLFTRP